MFTSISSKKDLKTFEENLDLAKKNVTEPGEREVLESIEAGYLPAFTGNRTAEDETINKITDLARINRLAMEQAGIKAKKQQAVEIWVILFPTVFIRIIGITLLKKLDRTFISPIQELNDVVFDYNKGNHMRRCPSVTVSKALQKLYDGINTILDNK